MAQEEFRDMAVSEQRLGRIKDEVSESSLCNEDLAPTEPEERTWTTYNIAALWIGMAIVITTYTLAAGLMAAGMNWWKALLTISLGNLLVLVPMLLNAHAGTKYGVPFPVFAQSVLVQVLNPKVALFFLAFLPQFVDPSRGAAWTQVIVLGATLAALGLFTDGLYALVGGAAGNWLKRKSTGSGLRRVRRYVSGGIYMALGVATAVSGSGKD